MLDKELVKRKLSLIQDELLKLEDLAKFSFEEIAKDYVKLSAVERILERIVNRALDINYHLISELGKDLEPPKDYKENFLKLAQLNILPEEFAQRISKSVGLRNILVHEYDKVDHKIVYASIEDCLKDYTVYLDYILKFLEKLD